MSAIFFRADGRKKLGMGHLARALTLAQELASAWGVRAGLIVRDDPAARAFLVARGVSPLWLGDDDDEARSLAELAARSGGAPFVFDVLDPDQHVAALEAVQAAGSRSLLVCDRARPFTTPADFVVSGHLDLPESLDPTRMYGGAYFMLDPRFAALERSCPPSPIRRLAVTLGGSDHEDLTLRLLRALADVAPGLEVDLAISRASGAVEGVIDAAPALALELRLHVDAVGLLELWRQAEAAVTAGGNSLFERVACRIPGATLCQTALQSEHARAMAERGVNVELGDGRELSDERLRRRLESFLVDAAGHRSQYVHAPCVIDGRGTLRVRERLELLNFLPGVQRCLSSLP